MNRNAIGILASTMGVLLTGSGCASTGGAKGATGSHSEIPRVLQGQAVAWNKGDLDGFMAGYRRSPDLTFSSGGKLTRGWQPMLDLFRKSYVEKGSMGKLTFSDLEVTDLGPDSALVLGRWRVEGKDTDSGAFSLVMRRIGGAWVIIHDHTSRGAP
jgi:beta-aspartyl-peptidase (threonine type)